MSEPTREQIAKLPKWAQDHIKDLSRQRDVSIRALNEFCDKQTPSPFYFEDYVCTGEASGPTAKRTYIQAHTIVAEWRGVCLRVDAHDFGNVGAGIKLQWDAVKNRIQEIAMVPHSFNAVRLLSKEDMR